MIEIEIKNAYYMLPRKQPICPREAFRQRAKSVLTERQMGLFSGSIYRTEPVLSDFNMRVERGEIVSVVGRSGAGKSTLLKIIAGLHKNYDGRVTLDGERLALIPQNQSLLPWETVYGNIVLLAKAKGDDVRRDKAPQLIEALGLGGFESRYPGRLSGGQYKRVALGQAFFYEPDVILMDEPFSGLDGEIKKEVQDLFLRLQRENGITTVFVTHDLAETDYMGSRTVKLE